MYERITGVARMKPERIQRRRTKGWRMPKNCVYVGRPSKFGNPFEGWMIAKLSTKGFKRMMTGEFDNCREIKEFKEKIIATITILTS